MSGPPLKKGRQLRKGFKFYENIDQWQRSEKSLAAKMIAEFAGRVRGVGSSDRPSHGKNEPPVAPPPHPADVGWGVSNHFHYIPDPAWWIRIGAFFGWLSILGITAHVLGISK